MAETKLWDGSQWVSVTDEEHRSASDPHSQYHNDTRGDARYLQQSNDLSDVDDAPTARTNLGLGSAATADSDDFDVAPGFLIDAVEGASNPWDLDGLVGNGTIVLLTTVTTVTLPDAADLPAGTEMRFANNTAGALSLTVNCAGSDEFPGSATSINPTIPVVGTVVVTKMDTAIGFEWGWSFFGNVSGPASATDSAIALFDGTTGKALKDSAVTISTDDTLASDSDSLIPTEQAVKAYVDANAGGGGLNDGVMGGALTPFEVGYWHTTPGQQSHSSGVTLSVSTSASRYRTHLTPMPVQRTTNFDRIGLYCSTAATDAGAIVYLGYCPALAYGEPDLSDITALGSVDVTSTGMKEITLSPTEQLTPGLWWLLGAFATSGTEAGTNPTFYGSTGPSWINGAHSNFARPTTYVEGSRAGDTDGDVDTTHSLVYGNATAHATMRIAMRIESFA